MSVTGLLTTNAGAAAILADLAGTAELVITHVAWGDAGGVPYNPVATQVALVNERYRAGIASVAVADGALVIEAVIPADTPDATARPSHGFSVAEAAIFGTTGGAPVMIGIARMSNGYKPAPASGQAAIATFRFRIVVANPAAITVVIDPVAQGVLGRNVRPFWITVDGVLNAPPANPAQGATYVIGAAPTGAWVGFAGRLAQWVGVWSVATAPAGHVVADNSKAESDPLRYLKFIGGVWISAQATDVAFGFARRATDAEITAGAAVNAYVPPDKLTLAPVVLPGGTPAYRYISSTTLLTAGSSSVTPPAGAKMGVFRLWGAGGGSSASAAGQSVNGAGGGEYRELTYVLPNANALAYTIGAGGAAAVYGSTGGTGGDTTIAGATAKGGFGSSYAGVGAGGTGGTGGFGIPGQVGLTYQTNSGGTGGAAPLGGSGGNTSNGGHASNGLQPGGGAGGPGTGGWVGRVGGAGAIQIEWYG